MPYTPLVIPPSVATQPTPLMLGEQGWSQSNLIRFKEGQLQKYGGCAHVSATAAVGVARTLHPFVDLTDTPYVGIGTTQRLMLYSVADGWTDITPIRATVNLTNAFSTTAGSPLVSIADSTTVAVGDWINIINAVFIGGLVLQGFYQVASFGSGTYAIAAPTNASSTVAGGGAAYAFTTTNASPDVSVTLGAYSFAAGQTITVGVSTAVGGLTLLGAYTNQNASPGTPATIAAAGSATSTASATENGGAIRIEYLLQSAVEGTVPLGYGLGNYGTGPYGQSLGSVTFLNERVWSLDNWGEDLVGCYGGSPIYVWVPPIAAGNVATEITQAPAQNLGLFVGMPEQIMIAYGCTDPGSGQQDPLLVRWCDVANYADWTASASNQAGSFRLSNGTTIVGGLQGPTEAFIWTDLDLWVMQYIGYPYVFGFNRVGWGCGLLSQRAVAQIGPAVYWMGQDEFFVYDGMAVSPLPCPVWDFVFANIDRAYPQSVFAAPNSFFSELAWFFPVPGSLGMPTAYVKRNMATGAWDCGYLTRSAWMDQSSFGAPISVDGAGLLQQQEQGNDLDGVAMDSWALSGLLGLADGQVLAFVDKVVPNFLLSAGASVLLTFFFYDWPADAPTQKGPFTVTAATEYIVVRGRGRYVQVKIESTAAGVFWRLGKLEALMAPAGRR